MEFSDNLKDGTRKLPSLQQYISSLLSVSHTLYFEDTDADLWWGGHEVTEELRWDLSQLKHFYRSLHTHINEQDVQHSAAVKVGDLKTETQTVKKC